MRLLQRFQGTRKHGHKIIGEHGKKSCVSDIFGNRGHQILLETREHRASGRPLELKAVFVFPAVPDDMYSAGVHSSSDLTHLIF